MKVAFLYTIITMCTAVTFGQIAVKKTLLFNSKHPSYVLDATCGTCMFKMKGTGCTLAVKYKNICYYVAGANIDDHGDAHDKIGFCKVFKKATVQGSVKKVKFEVAYFKLL